MKHLGEDDLNEELGNSDVSIFNEDSVVILDNVSIENVLKLDKDVFKAIDLFNHNHFNKAIDILQAKAEKDAIHAVSAGCLLFMKAISTFNKDDIDKAMTALELAINVADSQNTKKSGYFRKFTNLLFTDEEFNWINARSFTITSEANILSSFLFLFQESLTGIVKAGLYLTKGVRGVEDVFKWYKSIPADELATTIDANTIGALLFVIGAVNISTAMLPPKVLKVISIFGYTSDIKLGFQLMHECEEGNSLFAKLAPIFILGTHTIMLSFAPGTSTEALCLEMKKRLEDCLSQFPDSVFYLILANRFKRSTRELGQAATILRKAISVQDEWIGIKFLAQYELCMTHLFMGDYELVTTMANELVECTFWSKAFFSYLLNTCHDMVEKETAYSQALDHMNRKFGGKTPAIEQFVLKRILFFQNLKPVEANNRIYTVDEIRRLFLPCLEVIFLFLGFSAMNLSELQNALGKLTNALQISHLLNNSHLNNHLNLLKCAVLRNINIINKTYDLSILSLVEEIENDEMDWIKPFSVFEQGQLHVDAYLITKNKVYLERAKELLNTAAGFSGYILEFR